MWIIRSDWKNSVHQLLITWGAIWLAWLCKLVLESVTKTVAFVCEAMPYAIPPSSQVKEHNSYHKFWESILKIFNRYRPPPCYWKKVLMSLFFASLLVDYLVGHILHLSEKGINPGHCLRNNGWIRGMKKSCRIIFGAPTLEFEYL